jgi:hypothetical protein
MTGVVTMKRKEVKGEDWIEVTIQDSDESQPWDTDPDDEEADLAVCRAPADPDEAAKALLIAARYLRENRPLPWILRTYLAGALEASMPKSNGESRNTALLRELHLAAQNRRPVKTLWFEVGDMMEQELQRNQGRQNQAAKSVATHFKISTATVVRLFKEHIKYGESIRQIEWRCDEK